MDRTVGKVLLPRSVGFYIVGSVFMAASLYLLHGFIVYGRGTFFLTAELVAVSAVGVAVYGAIVLTLDKTFRDFLRRALRESFG